MIDRSTYLSGLLMAGLGAIFFSTKAIFAKLLYQHGVDGVDVIALRMLLSLPVFLLILILSWGRGSRLRWHEYAQVMLLGVIGYYGSSTLDFVGLEFVSAGLERQILFLTPTLTLMLGMLVYRRRIGRRQVASMLLAYAGIVLVFWHDTQLGGDNIVLGAVLVFAAALLYAVYLLLSGELVQRVGALRLVALAMIGASVISLLQFAVLRAPLSLLEQTPTVWGLSLLMATVATILPVFLTMFAIARIGAETTSQASMLGPVSTLFLAWWFLSEPITVLQIAGTLLVLAGIWLLSTHQPARERAPVPGR